MYRQVVAASVALTFSMPVFAVSTVGCGRDLEPAELTAEVYRKATERTSNAYSTDFPGQENLALMNARADFDNEFTKSNDFKTAAVLTASKWKLTRLQSYKLYAEMKQKTKRVVARSIYRQGILRGRSFMKELGAVWRAYVISQTMDWAWMRQRWMETMHEKGKDESSYGEAAKKGLVVVLSNVSSPSPQYLEAFRATRLTVGRDLHLPDGGKVQITPYQLSPMINLSGMSYPQLSANAVLSLLYMHIKLAQKGIRYTFNTGEGGPSLHMALLDLKTTPEALADKVARYAIENHFISEGSVRDAEVRAATGRLIDDRNTLLKEFTTEEINRAQIIGQLGPALNGARAPDDRLDLKVLGEWAQNPFYAGTQFKLKQAAKKGAKVDGSKVSWLSAYLRRITPGRNVEAPPISVEWANAESLAVAIVATKMVTKKPVSLKFAVGQAKEIYDMLEYLRDAQALPDAIQLDGSGYVRLPGSGNAPLIDNTSLNIAEAVMVVDASLKKLGVRDQVYLEATGDIVMPSEALMNLSLGADGVAAARLWMGMGLGCALVQKCATGGCYYGIANGDGKLFSEGLDPRVVGPKGAKAAAYWFEAFTKLYLESGAKPEEGPFRNQMGLNNPYSPLRIRGDFSLHALQEVFSGDEVVRVLQGRISPKEVQSLIYGKQVENPPPESKDDADRHLALRRVAEELLH